MVSCQQRHSTVPMHVRDVVLMTSRTKDFLSAAVEWGSDVENVFKSDSATNGFSSISESDSFTYPTISLPGDAGQRKRSLGSDSCHCGKRSKRLVDILGSFGVIDSGCRVDQTCQLLV